MMLKIRALRRAARGLGWPGGSLRELPRARGVAEEQRPRKAVKSCGRCAHASNERKAFPARAFVSRHTGLPWRLFG